MRFIILTTGRTLTMKIDLSALQCATLTYLEQVKRNVYSITRFYYRHDINDTCK